jgi:predicted MPP superfamily phosphohydrolase
LLRWIASFIMSFGAKNVAAEVGEVASSSGIPRSEFLAKTALAVGGLNLGVLSFGVLTGAHDYRVHKIALKLPNLPKAFEGMKVAQLSDIHSGSFYNQRAVKGGVTMLLEEKPDVVFFTGDLVNNEAKELVDYFDIFSKVKAPLGVFSILGNHDYGDYHPWKTEKEKADNLSDLIQAHKDMGWNLLLDEHRKLTVDNESIGILGIQNWGSGRFPKYGNLEKTMRNADEFDTKLLLSHDPSHWRAEVVGKTDIDAVFAGHTHGLQFGIEIGDFQWSPIKYRYPEWAGLYKEGAQQIYVNRGFGFLGYPGRVGILPEITIFTLSRG